MESTSDDSPDPDTSHAHRNRRDDVFVVERPWGHFQQFVSNEPVTVKTITVESGQRLSLQRHTGRAELWQVQTGQVEVTVEGQTWTAGPRDLVWVPVGAVHRLANPTPDVVRVLEICFGRFDEGDMERLQDDYARS